MPFSPSIAVKSFQWVKKPASPCSNGEVSLFLCTGIHDGMGRDICFIQLVLSHLYPHTCRTPEQLTWYRVWVCSHGLWPKVACSLCWQSEIIQNALFWHRGSVNVWGSHEIPLECAAFWEILRVIWTSCDRLYWKNVDLLLADFSLL